MGSNIALNIRWNSTPEFGDMHNIKVIKGKIGDSEVIERDLHLHSYSGTRRITLPVTQDSYFRIEANTSDGHIVYTNPVWIKTVR